MELKIAICDDNQSDIDRLSGLLTTYSFQTETDYQITRFNDGRRLIDSLRKEPSFPFHLVFLDIEMPRENGIDLAREVNRIMPSATLLVFVSSYPEYMGESFSVHPFDFLQKPVTTEQILRLMGDVRAHFSNMQRQLLIVYYYTSCVCYGLLCHRVIHTRNIGISMRRVRTRMTHGCTTCLRSLSLHIISSVNPSNSPVPSADTTHACMWEQAILQL